MLLGKVRPLPLPLYHASQNMAVGVACLARKREAVSSTTDRAGKAGCLRWPSFAGPFPEPCPACSCRSPQRLLGQGCADPNRSPCRTHAGRLGQRNRTWGRGLGKRRKQTGIFRYWLGVSPQDLAFSLSSKSITCTFCFTCTRPGSKRRL